MLNKSFSDWPTTQRVGIKHVVGVLQGEGVGAEIVPLALKLLTPLAEKSGRSFDIRYGGAIGCEAMNISGTCLSAEVISFCEELFIDGGALFCGPGGDRFVYELRTRFDLYCKFTPLNPLKELRNCGPIKPELLQDIDIIAVRENVSGLYQGQWHTDIESGKKIARHHFHYREDEVGRILKVAVNLARMRSNRLSVVVKPGGVPGISRLWMEISESVAANSDVELSILEIDNAIYQMIANPKQFDVIVSPNMFGDVIADCGALLLGSRGMSYSGNFGSGGVAVYQTGHGAARDIAGKDVVNPIGQIHSLAMMLEESFDWHEGASAVRTAVCDVLESGCRTRDITEKSSRIYGTRDFVALILECLETNLENTGG